ncbi:hypothetical protein [Streptomyces sp. UNOB3_S3]|uniref:hypothetical protein n=1 Tax=Streptomyces sp. UNOB3_S3 TaxID=2871682 RepID=UPI001E4E17E3|nr:hypothetical protein [Streptomyces sp. UNOB3_S3]MCC3773680.1 hypothetical protein [Streptomyces sp. UNOB3_S3]
MDETKSPDAPEASGVAAETPPPTGPEAELEKWKALSRQNEQRWEAASRELEELRTERMTDQEKALVQARDDARREALSELASSLAEAEIRAQAATAGVTVQTDYLDLARFLGEDGRPDSETVAAYIARQAPAKPEFPKLRGAGYYRGGSGPAVTSMDPNELADLIAGKSFI